MISPTRASGVTTAERIARDVFVTEAAGLPVSIQLVARIVAVEERQRHRDMVGRLWRAWSFR